MFWNLPFSSITQSHTVRKKAGVTEEDWSAKQAEIQAEHELAGAREQLASGWKEYLEKYGTVQAQASREGRPDSLAADHVSDSD